MCLTTFSSAIFLILMRLISQTTTSCTQRTNDMNEKNQIQPFKIIGISVRTSNEGGQAMQDMGALWSRFYKENIAAAIPGKAGEEIYSIYTDYESDHRGAYTAIIGFKVNSLDSIPPGMVGCEFKGGAYRKYAAKGEMPAAVVQQWQEIWNDSTLDRKYTADLEVYGEKAQDPADAGVDIYIAVK